MDIITDSIWFDVWITFVGLTLFLFVYTFPSFVAYMRDHKNLVNIMVVNVLFGFLVLPWIIMLVYATMSAANKEQANGTA